MTSRHLKLRSSFVSLAFGLGTMGVAVSCARAPQQEMPVDTTGSGKFKGSNDAGDDEEDDGKGGKGSKKKGSSTDASFGAAGKSGTDAFSDTKLDTTSGDVPTGGAGDDSAATLGVSPGEDPDSDEPADTTPGSSKKHPADCHFNQTDPKFEGSCKVEVNMNVPGKLTYMFIVTPRPAGSENTEILTLMCGDVLIAAKTGYMVAGTLITVKTPCDVGAYINISSEIKEFAERQQDELTSTAVINQRAQDVADAAAAVQATEDAQAAQAAAAQQAAAQQAAANQAAAQQQQQQQQNNQNTVANGSGGNVVCKQGTATVAPQRTTTTNGVKTSTTCPAGATPVLVSQPANGAVLRTTTVVK